MESNLTQLLANLKAAFTEEAAVKQRRVELEAQIADRYKNKLPEQGGSKTFTHQGVKFTVKQEYVFKADFDGLRTFPEALNIIKTKEEFNASVYKQLWKYNPNAAKNIAAYITATLGKPSVKIEEGE